MLSRREALEGAAGIAALVAVGGLGAWSGKATLLRPPGAQDEATLLGACLRCDRCRSACPRDVVGVATLEDGIINVSTPKMDFRRGWCDTCDGEYLCRKNCPVEAIGAFDRVTDRMGLAVIDFDRCLTYGISGSCSAKCIDKCPENALSLNDAGRLVLDESLCWGCGACEYFCISDSYGAYSGSIRRGINVEYREVGTRG